MKKTYMKPNMEVVKLQLETMIAQSNVTLSSSSAASHSNTGFTMDDKDDFDDFDESLW